MLAQILQVLRALKYVKQFIEWLEAYILKKRGEAKVDKAQKAVDAIIEANKEANLKLQEEKKRQAIKEMEDALRGK